MAKCRVKNSMKIFFHYFIQQAQTQPENIDIGKNVKFLGVHKIRYSAFYHSKLKSFRI